MLQGIKVNASGKRFPRYVKKPILVKRLCTAVGDRGDVGVAIMRGGQILGFCWGDNLTLEMVREMREGHPYREFVYVGTVTENDCIRDNFARMRY